MRNKALILLGESDMTENSWNNFDKVEPNECGFYNVKVVHTNPFSTWDDGTLKTSVRWDGEDFLLPIGRPITNEVMYWKKI